MGTIDNHHEAGVYEVIFPRFIFFMPYLINTSMRESEVSRQAVVSALAMVGGDHDL